jgi:hypothetical protein
MGRHPCSINSDRPSLLYCTQAGGPFPSWFSFRLAPGHYVLLARFRDGGHLALAFDRDSRVARMPYGRPGRPISSGAFR